VPDGGGQREDALHDAGDDAGGCAAVMLFAVELPLEGLVDRLDDLPQGCEQLGSGSPLPRPQPSALVCRCAAAA
jgi:hypothetical protein